MKIAMLACAASLALCAPGSAMAVTLHQTGTIVDYTITTSGRYSITAAGAQGGSPTPNQFFFGAVGGRGAQLGGEFYFDAGDVLSIAVGGQGQVFNTTNGGGGGGTFVVLRNFAQQAVVNTPIIVAGGGGGGAYRNNGVGDGGVLTIAGTAGNGSNPSCVGPGGDAGFGGGSPPLNPGCFLLLPAGNAGAGGGFFSGGQPGDGPTSGQGGASFFDGLAPGAGGLNGATGGYGGGGGGGGGFVGPLGLHGGGGGGGGGYSGGGGGYLDGGGGGGSYFTSDLVFQPLQTFAQAGFNSGDGFVTLEFLGAAVPEPEGWALMIGGFVGAGVVLRRRRAVTA